jgi:FkbM family methyltransferase
MRVLEKVVRRFLLPGCQAAYSQFGEDLILQHLFGNLGIERPTYLDIGANQPRAFSNTYYFYRRGSSGVLIEPNPRLSQRLSAARPRDIVVQAGVGLSSESEAEFYVFPRNFDGLSTFSKAEATHWQAVGMKGYGKIQLESVIRVPLVSVNDVMATHFRTRGPNLLSLDIEGLDLDVLKSLDFERFAPDVLCVETLSYDENQNGYKRRDTIEYAVAKNYVAYADTWANTIFCRDELLAKSA